jgi:hypothetical protein
VPGYALHSSEANDNTLIAYEDEYLVIVLFTAVGFEADDVDNALKIAKRSLQEQFKAKVRLEWAIDNSERNGALYRVYAEDRRSAFGVCFKIKFQDLEAIHQGFQGDEKLNKSHIPHSKYWRRTILVHFDGEDRYEEMFCSCPKKN